MGTGRLKAGFSCLMFYSSRVSAVRGATTVETDTPEAIEAAMEELLSALITPNGIVEAAVVSVFVSVTGDIHSTSPARIIRLLLNWQDTAIMSSIEPDIAGFPPRCIRLLIQFHTELPREKIRPAYLRGAAGLRPDLRP
jgi:chorismate mutase